MKRFRYKGDLSKHIKRYHPGHTQPLTPVPLQDDETTTISINSKTQSAGRSIPATITSNAAASQNKSSKATANSKACTIGATDNKFFLPLLPKHPVEQSELPGFSKPKNGGTSSTNPTLALVENNTDPSLDENILDLLTSDNESFSLPSNPSTGVIQTVGSGLRPRIQLQPSVSIGNISKVSFVVSKPSQGLAPSSKPINQNTLILRQQAHPLLPPPPPQVTTGRVVLPPPVFQTTSKLQEALLHGKPRAVTNFNRGERVTLVTAAGNANNGSQTTRFAVPTSTVVKPRQQTIIQSPLNISSNPANGGNGGIGFTTHKEEPATKPKTLTISISEVFACAQPLPLQEEAKQHNKGKMTTMADLEPQAASLGPLNAVLQQKGITLATNTTQPEPIRQPSPFFRQIINHPQQNVRAVLQQKDSATTALALQQSTKPITTVHLQAGNKSTISHQTSVSKPNLTKPSNPKKAFVCDHSGCNKSFDKANLLKRHAKLHSKQCKFVCDVCQKGFESQSKKEDHYRKHTGVKPFLCDLCGHSFRYKGKFYL